MPIVKWVGVVVPLASQAYHGYGLLLLHVVGLSSIVNVNSIHYVSSLVPPSLLAFHVCVAANV